MEKTIEVEVKVWARVKVTDDVSLAQIMDQVELVKKPCTFSSGPGDENVRANSAFQISEATYTYRQTHGPAL